MAVDPLIRDNFIDSCAFDPKYEPESSASTKILQLSQDEHFILNIAHSTQKEIEHPNTPAAVKAEAVALNCTLEFGITPNELKLLGEIETVLAGNGKRENIVQDARHIFEAQKYGHYFITADKRILDKRLDLAGLCGVGVVLPSEFLRIAEEFIMERKREV